MCAKSHKAIRRQQFLETMDAIVPWTEMVEIITPHYPTGARGRPPLKIETMLRMYLIQCWYNLSDVGTEETLHDSLSVRKFMKFIDENEPVPDATTLLKFRHLLEKKNLTKEIFDHIINNLEKHGYIMQGGTVVDATIISAPSSTKNRNGQRDPEMHQTKKGNQYYFGMKAHIGVDAGSGYIHTLKTTAANVSDITIGHALLREDDNVVYGDSGYIGLNNREEMADRRGAITFQINRRRHSIQKMPAGFFNWEKGIERMKSSVRSKVEHPFKIIKGLFGYAKTVYRGLDKNTHRLYMLFVSANLLMCALSKRHNGALCC